MRVLNCKLSTEWIKKSTAPGESVACMVVCGSELLDDQVRPTYMGELRLNVLSQDSGLAFYAKDADTLVRGLTYLAKNGKNPMAYLIQTGDRSGISLWGASWERAQNIRGSNKLTAGLSTAGHNAIEIGKRAIARLILAFDTLDSRDIKAIDQELYYAMHKQSVRELSRTFNMQKLVSFRDVMEQFDRDGKMARSGAFLYVCRTIDMPRYVDNGEILSQIPNTLSMGELAVKARQLFFGARSYRTPVPVRPGMRDGGIFAN